MDPEWPRDVTDFENFLKAAGLLGTRREHSRSFGNRICEYGSREVMVRVLSDRDEWSVQVASAGVQSHSWYDAAILRDLLNGSGPDVLPLSEQIRIVEDNWTEILAAFGTERAEETGVRLELLTRERVKRRIPGLHLE